MQSASQSFFAADDAPLDFILWPPDPPLMADTSATERISSSKIDSSDQPKSSPDAAKSKKVLRPVQQACLACRRKHNKCDGIENTCCSNCKASGDECVYVESRRGRVPRRRAIPRLQRNRGLASKSIEERRLAGVENSADIFMAEPFLQISDNHGDLSHQFLTPTQVTDSQSSQSSSPAVGLWDNILINLYSGTPQPSVGSLSTIRPSHDASHTMSRSREHNSEYKCNNMIDSYFENFHAQHPFLLPKTHLLKILGRNSLRPLSTVVQLIGSFFIRPDLTKSLRDEANRELTAALPKNGFSVQALLLFCIALQSAHELEQTKPFLNTTTNIALEIGMHHKEFAETNGENSKMLEESWRRTWWELYLVQGFAAGVCPTHVSPLFQVNSDVLLPCEEWQYVTGQIPRSVSYHTFEDLVFESEETSYSSFAYRIDAIRLLGKVLSIPQAREDAEEIADASFDYIDASLTNWELRLPPSKRNPMDRTGFVDEMLFQAHIIWAASIIILNGPRSHTSLFPAKAITTCAQPAAFIETGSSRIIHAAKARSAANDISRLLSLPTDIINHTPLTTCVITLAVIVNFSSWSFNMDISREFAKEQIRMNIGSLKRLAQVWPIASAVVEQVIGLSQEIFALEKNIKANSYFFTENSSSLIGQNVYHNDGNVFERPGEV